MEKIRIHKLAKDLNLPSKDLIEMLNKIGFQVESHMTAVTESEAQQMMRKLSEASRPNKAPKKEAGSKAEAVQPEKPKSNTETSKETATKTDEKQKLDKNTKFDEKEKANALNQDKNMSEKTEQKNKPEDFKKGDRPTYSNDRKPREGGYQKEGYQQQGDRKPREGGYQKDGNKPYGDRKPREGGYQREGYQQGDRNQQQGDRKPREGGYQKDGNKPYGDRKPREGGYQKDANKPYGDRKPREGGYQKDGNKPYGDRKPREGGYQKDANKPYGDRKPREGGYQKDGNKPYGDRKPYAPKSFDGGKDKEYDAKRGPKKDFKKDGKQDASVTEDFSVQLKKEEKRKEIQIGEKKKQTVKKKVDNRFESGEQKYQKRDLTKKAVGKGKKRKDKTKSLPSFESIEPQVLEGSIEDGMFVIAETITVGKLAEILKVSPTDIIMKLMRMGIMASINQEIKFETAEAIAQDYDVMLMVQEVEEESFEIEIEEDDPADLEPRAPIVTVMGHVDHGKTSLLDSIRRTGVALKEAGGITQHIGASEVVVNDHKIVFLDTPGHEAFTEMRARGAKVTDIAIIVVAADDGIMPQTIEAINHVKAAEVPMIIAINKIDKEAANIEKVRQELANQNVLVESWGGEVIDVPVSAKSGEGIDTLLNMILLVAEVEELKANPNRKAVGTVVESKLDKGRGAVATVLVENGTLKVGDAVVAGAAHGKIRAMINSKGNRAGKVGPSTAVEILGLNEVPAAGDQFVVVENDKIARDIAETRKEKIREDYMRATSKIHLEDLFNQMKEGEVKELKLIVKADVQGSIEALVGSLEKISNEEVTVRVIHRGVGAISESDIMLASASNAIIIGFNVRPTTGAFILAEREQVDVRTYSIIYQAIEEIETAMKGMLAPEFVEEQLGTAEVRMVFRVPGAGMAAGSYITKGKITRNSQVRLIRDGVVLYDGKIDSLRRFKDEVKEVATGYECGISLEKYADLKEGDIIEAYHMKEVAR